MRYTLAVLLLALALLLPALGGCSRSKTTDTRPVISVSVEPQRFLLEKLAGNRVTVNVLLPRGADPETFDPPMRTLRALEQSDLYMPIGSFPFEDVMCHRIAQSYPGLRVVMPEGLTILDGHHCETHHHDCQEHQQHDGCTDHSDDHHGSADPHVWTSVGNLRAMASQMHTQLIALDPQGREIYDRRYAALSSELDSLQTHITTTLAPLRGRSFLIWHPSLSYFANDYGLSQIAVQDGGKEPTPARMTSILRQTRHDNAAPLLIVNEVEHNPRMMTALNADLRLPQINISLMQGDLFKTLTTLSDALRSSYIP